MTTHRMSRTPEYRAWINMKSRCFYPNNKYYSDYGGRGIAVCDRWLNLDNFLADMGSRPTAKHSLDRIDNDGDYCPDNCRWATKAEQGNNKRNNKLLITIGNDTRTIVQWTEKMGYGENVIRQRLDYGWSEFDAVMTPVETDKLITIGNKTWTIAQWTKEKGYDKSVINNRLKRGWSEYRAVMTPVQVRLITIGNDTRTIAQWENKMGYSAKIIQNRLKLGWSEFDAVMTPIKHRKTA